MSASTLIVDDSPIILSCLRKYLEMEPSIKVCGEANDGIDAIEKAEMLLPDLIVLDLAMPRMNGLEAARRLKEKMPRVLIVLFTLHECVLRGSEAIDAGIDAVVSKPESLEQLKLQMLNILRLARRDVAASAK